MIRDCWISFISFYYKEHFSGENFWYDARPQERRNTEGAALRGAITVCRRYHEGDSSKRTEELTLEYHQEPFQITMQLKRIVLKNILTTGTLTEGWRLKYTNEFNPA